MTGDKREIELKFAVDAQRGEAVLAGFGAGATAPRSLESRYFDTADHALRKAGFTLRVRKDGDRWTQTVKSHLAADGLGRVLSAFAPSSILAQSCYVLVRSAHRKLLSEGPRYQRSCSLRCLWREC
jgi:hypothetical protein